ncbi:MAG: hypothetical protein A4C66_09805 [Nitrospira sp. HN-bin3]|nr:MAG: hypothetical protein A4C66_09805 [Nitrospira sp. HN-bin3]
MKPQSGPAGRPVDREQASFPFRPWAHPESYLLYDLSDALHPAVRNGECQGAISLMQFQVSRFMFQVVDLCAM